MQLCSQDSAPCNDCMLKPGRGDLKCKKMGVIYTACLKAVQSLFKVELNMCVALRYNEIRFPSHVCGYFHYNCECT